MKKLYIPIFITLASLSFTGCSVYKNSPTPDDVYYSPGAPTQEYASASSSSDYYSTANDNYIQMRVQDPDRWSYFDDYNYDYYGGYSGLGYGSPYSLGLGLGFGYSPWIGGFGYYNPYSFWNSYYAWNSFYNPYYGGIVIVNGKNLTVPSYTRLSTFNPVSYQSRAFNSRPASTNRFYNGNAPANNAYRNNIRSYNGNNYYNRPMNNTQPVRTAPSNFGGGGGFRGGGGSRPGR